ncbi:hypothetical protein NHQ30_009633 [Ciborinia camelliae]|nr:hypothetical protein NHQ30_009633 [Ciborinia camelliae]
MLIRREPYPNLPARAPVDLHKKGKLFSNPVGIIDRATTEDIVETYEPTGKDVEKVKKFVEKRFTSVSRDEYEAGQEEENDDEEQTLSPSTPHYSDSGSVPPPKVSPKKSLVPAKRAAKRAAESLQHQHQRKRQRPSLSIITSPTKLAKLETCNLNPPRSPTPPNYSPKSANCSPNSNQNQTPFGHSPQYSGSSPSTPRMLTRSWKPPRSLPPSSNMLPNSREITTIQTSPDSQNFSVQPPSTSRTSLSEENPAFNPPIKPYLIQPPTTKALNAHQYIEAILALRKSTADPTRYPLPPKSDMKNLQLAAMKMQWVEDAIRLDGAPLEAMELYYEQFAQEEF